MNKEFLNKAIIRAIRTICQTALSFLAVGMTLSEVNWIVLMSTSILAGFISILTSVVTGLPEANVDGAIGELTVVDGNDGPQIMLSLNSEKALDVIRNKDRVTLDTSNIKV